MSFSINNNEHLTCQYNSNHYSSFHTSKALFIVRYFHYYLLYAKIFHAVCLPNYCQIQIRSIPISFGFLHWSFGTYIFQQVLIPTILTARQPSYPQVTVIKHNIIFINAMTNNSLTLQLWSYSRKFEIELK